MTRYIFITGGVVSSLGKGVASATLGTLLQARDFSVILRKLDPYLNVDPGTISPSEHGEVFVTDDGTEADLDLGHYERFTGNFETQFDTTTTGKIYNNILKKERKGDFLGKTLQIVPHVTNSIKEFITNKTEGIDFVLIEIGGTVGDIEGLPFCEAIRQLNFELGKANTCFVHLTYLPYILVAEELKTKPTQHSVKILQSLGIQPDILLCRADIDIPPKELKKISLFCNVKEDFVIPALNANSIYDVPLMYHQNNFDSKVIEHFGIKDKKTFNIDRWQKIHDIISNYSREVKIAVVGKYVDYKDSYKSIIEALSHGGIENNVKVKIVWIDSRKINNEKDLFLQLQDIKGILVPGGFGYDGIEGKILAAKYARENNIPYLGICLGMQIAIIEFARNVLNLKDANSTEFVKTSNPVISLITEWLKEDKIETRNEDSNLGGTMRLGGYDTKIKKDTLLYKIYQKTVIRERHRHRYEVNIDYKERFETNGLIFSAMSIDGKLPECIEIKDHKFFVGVQFHPELTSKPFDANPLFNGFVRSCLQ